MNQPSNDDDKVWVGYHVVCFLDILGQRDKLKQWPVSLDTSEPSDEFISALKQTAGTVRSYRSMYRDFFDQFGSQKLLAQRLTPGKQHTAKRLMDCSVSSQQFSDTIVFYAPVTNSFGDISKECFTRIVQASGALMLAGLAGGAPIRGGIDVGLGMEIESGFYGPALVDAYSLESTIAEYPRVVLSSSAVKFSQLSSGFSNDRAMEEWFKELNAKQESFVCKDSDGHTIVDFMGTGVHRLMSGHDDFPEVVASAFELVTREQERFEAEGNLKLAARYSRLLEYMQPRLSIWNLEQ